MTYSIHLSSKRKTQLYDKVLMLDTLGSTSGTNGDAVNVMFAISTPLHRYTNLMIGIT
jgi:hypothetical protein